MGGAQWHTRDQAWGGSPEDAGHGLMPGPAPPQRLGQQALAAAGDGLCLGLRRRERQLPHGLGRGEGHYEDARHAVGGLEDPAVREREGAAGEDA